MSQAGPIDVIGGNPTIPTDFVTDDGVAVPIANTLEILGTSVPAGTIPVETTGSGNTVTIEVQTSQAIAASDATKIGLSAFDSAAFAVDANGFVTFAGAGAVTTFNVDAHTAPGTDPVSPVAGMVTLTGAQVATGTIGANVIRTDSLAAGAITIEIQRSTAVAASDTTKNGVAHFNSTQFNVGAGGFVELAGGGLAIDSISVQTGTSPVVPTAAGLVTINGAVVAAGTNPVRSDGTGANTMALEVQISQAIAATDATKIGLSNFNSSHFTVDANGFVGLATAGPFVTSVSGTANRITSTGGTTPVIDISAAYVGQTSITTLGTITTGTWNGTAIGPAFGGTGQTTYATGDILYASAANTLSKLAATTNGFILSLAAGIPSWIANNVGDVVGPASATDTALARYNGTTGKLIQDSVATMTSTGSTSIVSSNSGATNLLLMENTSNTASSRASFLARVAGSSAGDAYYQATVNGVTDWSWGLDNSDSDAWVLSNTSTPGTGNVMRAATAGQINFPLQPAFAAYVSSTITNVTGNATQYVIVANWTEIFDVGGNFSAGTFTAPVTGTYRFEATINMQGLTGVTSLNYQFFGTPATIYFFEGGLAATIANGRQGASGSCTLQMAANDVMQLRVQCQGAVGDTADVTGAGGPLFTFFSGSLIA